MKDIQEEIENVLSLPAETVAFEEILDDIIRRDERDMGREDSPLKPASDAHLIDTTEMSIDTAFEAALAIVTDAVKKT